MILPKIILPLSYCFSLSAELSSVTVHQYIVTDEKHKILITEIKFEILTMMIKKSGNVWHNVVNNSIKSLKLDITKTRSNKTAAILLQYPEMQRYTEITLKLFKSGSY